MDETWGLVTAESIKFITSKYGPINSQIAQLLPINILLSIN